MDRVDAFVCLHMPVLMNLDDILACYVAEQVRSGLFSVCFLLFFRPLYRSKTGKLMSISDATKQCLLMQQKGLMMLQKHFCLCCFLNKIFLINSQ